MKLFNFVFELSTTDCFKETENVLNILFFSLLFDFNIIAAYLYKQNHSKIFLL